jgi:hypothetical protein
VFTEAFVDPRFASKKATTSADAENTRELWESFCDEKIKEVAEYEMSQRGRFRRIYPPVAPGPGPGQEEEDEPEDDRAPVPVPDELSTEKILDFLIHASKVEAGNEKGSVDGGDSGYQLSRNVSQLSGSSSSGFASMTNSTCGRLHRSLSRCGRTFSSSSVLRDLKVSSSS